jgi:hypothetical protein
MGNLDPRRHRPPLRIFVPNASVALAVDWFTQASLVDWIFGYRTVRTEYEYRILFGRQQLAVPIVEHQAVPEGPKGPSLVCDDFSTFSLYDFFCTLIAVRPEGMPKCDLEFRVVHAPPLGLFLHVKLGHYQVFLCKMRAIDQSPKRS